ncbi:MAG: MATE family efflux transporter [Firmicutes bacterium]|nr:MATE family efflux transporter [Bacillota bacterium]
MKHRHNINMLEGSIADKVLLFAIPLAVTGILQQLFNAADVAVVGQFAGKDAMAAVGSNSPIIGLLVNLFIGIGMGANVVASNYTGQKNRRGISHCVHTAVLFALLAGVFVTLVGEICAGPILRLMGVPENIFDMALAYLRIYLLGMPVIFLYNFESALFRSQGDTRTPLICLIISGSINVALNIFFVVIVGMAAGGVALATVIANLVSSGLLFIMLTKRQDHIRLYPNMLKIHGRELKLMMRIGVPAGVQGMVFSLSNILIQSSINSLGSDVIAASSAAFNIEIFCFFILSAFGQTATTFIGQNYGAGNLPRCRKIFKVTLGIDMIATSLMAILILVFASNLLGIFNGDPDIIAIGVVRIRMIVTFEVINVIMECASGAMRGYGFSLVPALITLIGVCGTRIFWVFCVFSKYSTFAALMMVYPASWVVTCISLLACYMIFIRKLALREGSLV